MLHMTTHTKLVSYARADACLLVQTIAGPSHGDTSDLDELEDVDNTGAKPVYSTEFMVQSCMDMLNHRPPNPIAVATVATGADEAEKGSADENGSEFSAVICTSWHCSNWHWVGGPVIQHVHTALDHELR